MVKLSFFEDIKDKATGLIPNPYMDMVEECTLETAQAPTYEHVIVLCQIANNGTDSVVDVVRAIRRRLDNSNPQVQFLTVQVLSSLMKNCGPALHSEVASQRALLRELQNIATRPIVSSASARNAKNAALGLIANMSVWFSSHPDRNCVSLSLLANDVREISGPNAFEGIQPETNVNIQYSRAAPPETHGRHARHGHGHRQRQERRTSDAVPSANFVVAIPLVIPSEADVAAMLDNCLVLAEYLNNVETTADGKVERDDIIDGLGDKINSDKKQVQIALSCGEELSNRDVLHSVIDSQNSILKRITSAVVASGSSAASSAPPQTQPRPVAASPAPVPAPVPAPAPVQPAPAPAPAPPVTTPPAQPVAPPQQQPKTNLDDLFGPPMSESKPAAVVVAPPPPAQAAPAPAPAAQPKPAAPIVVVDAPPPPPPTVEPLDMEKQASSPVLPAPAPSPAQTSTPTVAEKSMSVEAPAAAVAPAPEVPAAPAPSPAPAPAPAPAAAPAPAPAPAAAKPVAEAPAVVPAPAPAPAAPEAAAPVPAPEAPTAAPEAATAEATPSAVVPAAAATEEAPKPSAGGEGDDFDNFLHQHSSKP